MHWWKYREGREASRGAVTSRSYKLICKLCWLGSGLRGAEKKGADHTIFAYSCLSHAAGLRFLLRKSMCIRECSTKWFACRSRCGGLLERGQNTHYFRLFTRSAPCYRILPSQERNEGMDHERHEEHEKKPECSTRYMRRARGLDNPMDQTERIST